MSGRASIERDQRAFHIEAARGKPWGKKELVFERPAEASVAGARP